MEDACKNTDREIWRRKPGDFYSPSIHVTEFNGIGINVGGHVLVSSVEEWHWAGNILLTVNPTLKEWRRRLALRLLDVKEAPCPE